MGGIFNPVTAQSIGAVPVDRQVIAGTNMTGGGALSSDVTLDASGGGGGGGALTKVGEYAVATAGDAFIDIPLDADGNERYLIILEGQPSASAFVGLQLSIDDGSNFLSGASDYKRIGSNSDNRMLVTSTNGAGRDTAAQVTLTGMNNVLKEASLTGTHWTVNSAGAENGGTAGGGCNALLANDYNAIRLLVNAGNMDDFTINIYSYS